MEIVDTLKFGIGIVFLAASVFVLAQGRRERGFGQKRQLGTLLLLAGGIFLALGLGYIEGGLFS